MVFAYGAIIHRNRQFGIVAAVALPVSLYLFQAPLFDWTGISSAWHALSFALLVPLYLVGGYKLRQRQTDPHQPDHAQTALQGGVMLILVSALWAFTSRNGLIAAISHAVLVGDVLLATLLWRRPTYLYAASMLTVSATSFALSELPFINLPELSVGWANLSILHIIIALNLNIRYPILMPNFAKPLVRAGYIIAAASLIPPFILYDGPLLAYALANWFILSAWGAYLQHQQYLGFNLLSPTESTDSHSTHSTGTSTKNTNFQPLLTAETVFHWFMALSLPVWLWVMLTNRRPPDFSFALIFAVLAGGMLAGGYWLKTINPLYRKPWRLIGGLLSIAAPVLAFRLAFSGFTPALVLLLVGGFYFTDAIVEKQSGELFVAGLVTAAGYSLLFHRFHWSQDAIFFFLALLISSYILISLFVERRNIPDYDANFLTPLYLTSHFLTALILRGIYLRPVGDLFGGPNWSDSMRLWGAAAQLTLSLSYGLYAWQRYRERWAHGAIWLIAMSGAFIGITFSSGRGSSAAKAAIGAFIFVLIERILFWSIAYLKTLKISNSFQVLNTVQRLWHLYWRPLLGAGWTISAVTIFLALVRNMLSGGRTREIWSMLALWIIVTLYACSARWFRRARFVWLATVLSFAPWTLLTHLGWFIVDAPRLPQYALSWLILAWLLFLLNVGLKQLTTSAYTLPLRTVSQLLIPFSLLWGLADNPVSRISFALAIGLYGLAALLDYYQATRHWPTAPYLLGLPTLNISKFLYPAIGLLPIWAIYLLYWINPMSPRENYGLLILLFVPFGLAGGQLLEELTPQPNPNAKTRFKPRLFALSAYLTAYLTMIIGTLWVSQVPYLLALVLLYDVLFLVISARIFLSPLWLYPAVVLVPVSLLIALDQAQIPTNRQGWWLIGLAAIYFGLSWSLHRLKLLTYSNVPLMASFVLVLLGLPLSSQDQIGAIWGYGSAALLYGLIAFWLNQPMLLFPVSALAMVSYAVIIQRSPLSAEFYGLMLLLGAIMALSAGRILDRQFGAWRDFPWFTSNRWIMAVSERVEDWWALAPYLLGFGLVLVAPIFTAGESSFIALNSFLAMPFFGWAVYRFRLRGWLLATAVAGHLALFFYLKHLGMWQIPAQGWLMFMPITFLTAGFALGLERYFNEGSPFDLPSQGWSRPLYLLLVVDIMVAQLTCLSTDGSWQSVTISLLHAMLIGLFVSIWLMPELAYLSLTLGVVALWQYILIDEPPDHFFVIISRLALLYGLIGFGMTLYKDMWHLMSLVLSGAPPPTERNITYQPLLAWKQPLQRFSIGLSTIILFCAMFLTLRLIQPTIFLLLGWYISSNIYLPTVWMAIGVLSWSGLLYMTAAAAYRQVRLGYLSLGLLLSSWMLFLLYIQQWDGLRNLHWYTIPVGTYLFGISFLEWTRGSKPWARWLDYFAMLIIVGSLFWQILLFGWFYALLLGSIGLGLMWVGSARRLRRFLYVGMGGVILAALGQLINALWSVNQWMFFGLIGLTLLILGLVAERKREQVLALRDVLDDWE